MKFSAKSFLVIVFIALFLFVLILACDSQTPIKAHDIVVPERETIEPAIDPADKSRLTFEEGWAELEIQEEPEEEPEEEHIEETTKENQETSTKSTGYVYNLSSSDQTILEKLAWAEMGNTDTYGMALVIKVVLNRVESDKFDANTVSGVVFQKRQFSVISNGSYYSATPNEQTHEALEMVMKGWDETKGALFFDTLSDSWASQNRPYAFSYAGVNFYY